MTVETKSNITVTI